MADFNFGDGLRKVFLAGVGALATTVEKSQEIVDDLVKKGELTVEQGKALNAELKHKVEEAKEAPEAKDAAPAETEEAAVPAREKCHYPCKPAIVMLLRGVDENTAKRLLSQADGRVALALRAVID